MPFERIGSETIWEGRIATVRVDTVRFDDGEVAEREIVEHPGAVAVLAHDDEYVYLVRQPREPVNEQALLELPAGKLNGADPLETGKRELAEEIGKGARTWEFVTRFYSSPGFAAEEVHLYLATDLYDEEAEAEEEERIEIVAYPLDELDDLIRACADAKSLVALLWFKSFMR